MAVVSRPIPQGLNPRSERKTHEASRGAGLLVTLAIVAALMSVLYLAQTGRIATQGYTLEQLEAQRIGLVRANQQLQFEIERAQSLDSVRQRATAMGFVPSTSRQARYLVIEVAPAKLAAAAR